MGPYCLSIALQLTGITGKHCLALLVTMFSKDPTVPVYCTNHLSSWSAQPPSINYYTHQLSQQFHLIDRKAKACRDEITDMWLLSGCEQTGLEAMSDMSLNLYQICEIYCAS